jgi:hypothetical protein
MLAVLSSIIFHENMFSGSGNVADRHSECKGHIS